LTREATLGKRQAVMILEQRTFPIVLAPLAGGASTPELAAAVSNAGGLGFLAAGYLSARVLAERLATTRQQTAEAFGVNMFVPSTPDAPAGAEEILAYAERLRGEADAAGGALGTPRHDDDDWAAKIEVLTADPVAVVSFTFGLPAAPVVEQLHEAGSEVWITVTSVPDAVAAAAVGADVLVVQGAEAGGHRGGLDDDPRRATGLLALLQLCRARVHQPLVATGGIATGAAIAAVLACGARAAALGTAFLDCPEAGTSPVHRDALHSPGETAFTRAFTGRTARGIRNRFLDGYTAEAPRAYPEIHHLTAPLRQAARERGDRDLVNLWAGEAYPLTRRIPAGDLVRLLAGEARAAFDAAAGLLPSP
jgi:nitronate monooxygenase